MSSSLPQKAPKYSSILDSPKVANLEEEARGCLRRDL